MHCKYCNYPDSYVVNTKRDDKTNHIYRRRECIRCGLRFSTAEHLRDTYKRGPYITNPPLKVLPK